MPEQAGMFFAMPESGGFGSALDFWLGWLFGFG